MNKIDWVRKLTSRKFWVAVAGLVTGIILTVRSDTVTAEAITGIIMMLGSVVAYIIGEGLTDYASLNNASQDKIEDHKNERS